MKMVFRFFHVKSANTVLSETWKGGGGEGELRVLGQCVFRISWWIFIFSVSHLYIQVLFNTIRYLTNEHMRNKDVHINIAVRVSCTRRSASLYYFTTIPYVKVQSRYGAKHCRDVFLGVKKIGISGTSVFEVSTLNTDQNLIDAVAES